ncbi:hypothetical protein HY491_00255 [Candidatus Woesearchaeota archaeon]|nr:hypothetical protein [Candidatus Woesearchaeota archaeon]
MADRVLLLDLHRLESRRRISQYTRSIQYALIEASNNGLEIVIAQTFNDPVVIRRRKQVDISPYRAVVFSGSDYPLLEQNDAIRDIVTQVIEQAEAQRKYVLAICAGIQITARVFGQDVYSLEHPEAGWYWMSKTESGKRDPVLAGIPDTFELFSTHGKAVMPTDGRDCHVLVENKNCIQMMRFGEHVYGVQGHPDDTLVTARIYLDNFETRIGERPKNRSPTREDIAEEPRGKVLYGAVMLQNFLRLARE